MEVHDMRTNLWQAAGLDDYAVNLREYAFKRAKQVRRSEAFITNAQAVPFDQNHVLSSLDESHQIAAGYQLTSTARLTGIAMLLTSIAYLVSYGSVLARTQARTLLGASVTGAGTGAAEQQVAGAAQMALGPHACSTLTFAADSDTVIYQMKAFTSFAPIGTPASELLAQREQEGKQSAFVGSACTNNTFVR